MIWRAREARILPGGRARKNDYFGGPAKGLPTEAWRSGHNRGISRSLASADAAEGEMDLQPAERLACEIAGQTDRDPIGRVRRASVATDKDILEKLERRPMPRDDRRSCSGRQASVGKPVAGGPSDPPCAPARQVVSQPVPGLPNRVPAPVAQLDRALPSEGRGREFESRRVRHLRPEFRRIPHPQAPDPHRLLNHWA